MGTMGHLGFKMNVVTSTIPLLIIAVSNSYGIHILQRYNDERLTMGKMEAVRTATSKILPAILLTGVTSAIGSITLLVFKVTSLMEFGIFTSLGILNIVVISITIMPALLSILKSIDKNNVSAKASKLDSWLLRLANFSIRREKVILSISVILLLISGYGISSSIPPSLFHVRRSW